MSPPSRPLEKRIRIWIVANRRLVLDSLTFFLEKQRQFQISGATDFSSDHLDAPASTKVDAVVVYLEPGDSVEFLKDLPKKFSGVRIIAITDAADLESSVNALKLGAVGIVQATQGTNSLIAAIRKTHAGETWLNQELLNGLLKKGVSANQTNAIGGHAKDSLTPREIEVISMIAEGLKSKAIAERLSISQATVRHHLSSIYGKLGVDGRLNLMIYAVEKGLIQFEHQLQ